MDSEKILLVFLGIFISTVFQLISSYFTKKTDKSLKHTEQLKLLTSELEDLIRHCIANQEVLHAINFEKGVPSMLHFEKMKVMESSLIFSQETFNVIDSKFTRHINRLKLEIRNINLEIDYVIKYRQGDDFQLPVFKEYFEYLLLKTNTIVKNLPSRLGELIKVDDQILKRIEQYRHESRVKTIIYD
ncbi:hypothetical protein [Mongoliitalea daihaiensis]|uniref:hypothetical protein n=1 Tax=Mongoliitalea daihaiensis TaxID=2782006 RepID=UPI001F1958E7|nr:hypothetical protein [Mongoliitalea daihaiensis]UJP64896.1 hypothetical protein IPZ59_19235 [Mongoliitalea daihaiensis]